MALSFFSSGGSSHSAKYFDIRLDEDYIVFRGNEQEASSAHLKGTVVLCLSEPLTIKHLKLHLTGISRVCWHQASGSGRKSGRERTFFEKSWGFRDAGKNKTEIMAAGNYEFPFDVVLGGSLPESIEGLHDTWITYRFKAEIGRKYTKDIHVRKPLRIIRTLDPSALELAHAMSVENVWPNKIEYSISTPSKAVIFGTSLRVDFRLVPILKGLKIGLIASEFIESHDLTLNPEDPDAFHSSNKSTRVIVCDSFELDEERQLEILDEDVEGYRFSRTLNLPKTLNKCLQDADVRGIKIRHKLKFRVQLHNPDGHTSELRATLPVSVFISPNLPIDENNNLIDQTPESAQRAALSLVDQAPPLYGEHQFDQLYSELDPNGYRTPGDASGPQTPFSSLSRNLSMENIAAAVNAETQNISAAALQHRLNNLHLNGSATTPSTPPSEPAEQHTSDRPRSVAGDGSTFPSLLVNGVASPDATPGISRRTSEKDYPSYPPSGVATPRPQFSQVEDLSRVPSYTTAVRSNLHQRSSPHNGEYLPDYQAATANDVAAVSASLSFPQQAHIGNRSRPPLAQQRSHSHNGSEDMERRLRIIQARARA